MKRDEKGRFLPKSVMSLKDAVRLIYLEMPNRFNGVIFVERIRHLIGRELCYSDSALRELRRMRKRKEGGAKCVNRELSIYQKLPIIPIQ